MNTIPADGGGLRYNEGKPPLELIPPEMIWAVAEVLAYGAKKYAPRTFERGMSWSTVYACLFRHLLKWFQGEDRDAESGLSHLDHVLWNAMALVVYERRRIGTDDRPVVQTIPEGSTPIKAASGDIVAWIKP
jgi:hypothetical protein